MLNWIVLNRTDYLHKMDLALNNLQRLIYHKTQQTKPNIHTYMLHPYAYKLIYTRLYHRGKSAFNVTYYSQVFIWISNFKIRNIRASVSIMFLSDLIYIEKLWLRIESMRIKIIILREEIKLSLKIECTRVKIIIFI